MTAHFICITHFLWRITWRAMQIWFDERNYYAITDFTWYLGLTDSIVGWWEPKSFNKFSIWSLHLSQSVANWGPFSSIVCYSILTMNDALPLTFDADNDFVHFVHLHKFYFFLSYSSNIVVIMNWRCMWMGITNSNSLRLYLRVG